MTRARTSPLTFGIAAIVGMLALLLSGGLAVALQATPVVEEAAIPHPAHIHAGTCDELGEVIYPLSDVTVEEGNVVGFPGPSLVATSFSTVDAALETILASPHAINVHLSAEEIGTYIACGNIGGIQRADGGIPIELRELSDSGFQGIAYLSPNPANPAQTDVSVFLAQELGIGEEPGAEIAETPMPAEDGTPEAAAAEANMVQVGLTEFEINMPTELPAGPTTFEVTNNGSIVHNFEVEGQGIEEEFEENLQPGETRTMTLDLEPGTYEVYCPVGNHAEMGMRLELTVTQ